MEDDKWAQRGFPISHYNTEHAAYLVGSYFGQALGMRVYPADSGGVPQYQVWNKGWRTADVETMRARGVSNILRDFYPGSENYYLPGVKGLPVNP